MDTKASQVSKLTDGLGRVVDGGVTALYRGILNSFETPQERRNALVNMYPLLVARDCDLATQTVVDWYSEERAEAGYDDDYVPEFESYDDGLITRAEATARRLAGGYWTGDDMLPGLVSWANKTALGLFRLGLLRAATRDPAEPTVRVRLESRACKWCREQAHLVEASPVRRSSRLGAIEKLSWHGLCRCSVEVKWPRRSVNWFGAAAGLLVTNQARRSGSSKPSGSSRSGSGNAGRPNGGSSQKSPMSGNGGRKPPKPPTNNASGADDNPATRRPDYNQVPEQLKGKSYFWPNWLQPVTLDRWQHVLEDHSPESNVGKTKFRKNTNIIDAILKAINTNKPIRVNPKKNYYQTFVNGQEIRVVMILKGNGQWFLVSAHPLNP